MSTSTTKVEEDHAPLLLSVTVEDDHQLLLTTPPVIIDQSSSASVLIVGDHSVSTLTPPPPRYLKKGIINKSWRRALKRRHFNEQLKHSCDHQVTVGGLCFVCGCKLSSNYVDDDEMVPLKYVLNDFSITKKKFFFLVALIIGQTSSKKRSFLSSSILTILSFIPSHSRIS